MIPGSFRFSPESPFRKKHVFLRCYSGAKIVLSLNLIIMDKLMDTVNISRNYTTAVADAMPSEDYSFRPAREVWSFGELIHHIAYGIIWWRENFIEGSKTDWNPPAAGSSKKEILAYLRKGYDELQKILSERPSDRGHYGIGATLDHITHHRGQATTYLRLKGIAPPEYVY